jgi:hypothetical protein
MQNAPYLTSETHDFLDDVQSDYDVELFGKETDEAEDVETACTWNGHSVGYSNTTIHRLTFEADGFKWAHPNGAIISGMFAKPTKAPEVVRDDGGDEMEREDFLRELRTAIVAKSGRISGFADSNLI